MMEEKVITNPFPGLRSFEEEEEYLFFGREKQIDELLSKLSQGRFLAVVGASGSGKSSLVKSGLLPSLHSGFMSGIGSGWKICVFRPGDDPVGNMARGFLSDDLIIETENEDEVSWPMIESVLRRSKKGIEESVRQFSINQGENLLIVVDQFEELFRFSKYEKVELKGTRDSVVFINLLLEAVEQSNFPIYVVFTMRSDFLGDCTEFRGLPEAINKGQYLIPRMTRDERKMAISGPIAVGGGSISQPLLTMLLNDVGDNPDQLPILQHALMRTWDYWVKTDNIENPIDVRHYQAIGTLEHALSYHADEAFNEINSDEGKKVCEKMFKALTDEGTTAGGVRKPTKLIELQGNIGVPMENIKPIIEIFRARGRSFLMPPIGIDLEEESVIDISHESLMRVWERLRNWVAEESESSEIYKRIAHAAALYQDGKGGLYRNPELQIALLWKERVKPTEQWALQYDTSFVRAITFLNHSKEATDFEIEQKEKEQKNRLKRSRIFAMIIGVAFIIALVLSVFAYIKELEAVEQKHLALTEKEHAINSQKEADEQRVIAEEQKSIAMEQKEVAVTNQQIAEEEKLKAENLAVIADRERNNAVASKHLAQQKKIEAIAARDSAHLAREQAEKARIEEEKSKIAALNSEKETRRLRNLADARNKSFVAIDLIDEGRLQAGKDSALLAYDMFSSNGGSSDNTEIYNALSKAFKAINPASSVMNQHTSGVVSLALNPTSNVLVSSDQEGVMIVSELSEGKISVKKKKKLSEVIKSADFSSNGEFLIAGTDKGNVLVWNQNDLLNGNAPLHSLSVFDDGVKQINTVTKNSSTFIFVLGRNNMKLLQMNSEGLKDVNLSLPSPVSNGLFAVDSAFTQLMIANGNKLSSYEILFNNQSFESLKLKAQSNAPAVVSALTFSPDYKNLMVGGIDGKIGVFNSNSLELIHTLTVHKSQVSELTVVKQPTGYLLAASSFDNSCSITKIQISGTGENIMQPVYLFGHTKWVYAVAKSNFHKFLVSTSEDHSVRFWFTQSSDMAEYLKK